MERLNEIYFDQILHGYRNGHRILSSSADLVDSDRRRMLYMSDYSGSGFETKFKNYITGYPLHESKFYVLAKTWYADEMVRPGCVWTHSILINFTDLWAIIDLKLVLALFQRPSSDNFVSKYSNKIAFENKSEIIRSPLSNSFYKLSCELYSSPGKGVVVLAESSNDYEDEIIGIWNWQWPRMKRNFTFCTGSLSLRKYEGSPLDLQLFPESRVRLISESDKVSLSVVRADSIDCSANWLDQYINIDLAELKNFSILYGSDVHGTRQNFVSLLQAYYLWRRGPNVSVDEVDNFFIYYFNDSNQAKYLKEFVVRNLFNVWKNQSYEILNMLLSNPAFAGMEWEYGYIIVNAYEQGILTEVQIDQLIQGLTKVAQQDEILTVLRRIPIDVWFNIELVEMLAPYLSILAKDESFSSNTHFWKLNIALQKAWFEALKSTDNRDWTPIVLAMIEAGIDTFADEIAGKCGVSIVDIIFEVSSNKNISVFGNWIGVLYDYKADYCSLIFAMNHLNRNSVRLFLNLCRPKDSFFRDLSSDLVDHFIVTVLDSGFEIECAGVLTFFLNAAYEGNLMSGPDVNIRVFQRLHDYLSRDIFEPTTWERFKWAFGEKMYDLVEMKYVYKWFNNKTRVPDWDRCEFLRRAYLIAVISFNWRADNFFYSIKSRDAFERLVEFGVEVPIIYEKLLQLFHFLKGREESDFHYKVLKKML